LKGLRAFTALVLCAVLIIVAWRLDAPVAKAVDIQSFPALGPFARAVSRSAEGWVVAVAGLSAAAFFGLRRRPDVAKGLLIVTFAALLTGGTATIFRCLIGRTRPGAQAPQGVYGVRRHGHWIFGKYEFASFPSGHAATAVAVAAALWRRRRRDGLVAAPYAVLVCWSRVALGNHHFSDVVAASCLGIAGPAFFAPRLDPMLDHLKQLLAASFRRRPKTQAWREPAPAAAAISRLKAANLGIHTPLLSVVVPCYNEQGNLGPLTEAIAAALEPLEMDWEVLFVDDCSRDNSWQVVTELVAARPQVRGLRLARNSGQSAAIWAGLRAASSQFVATMDADLQNVPADLPALMAGLENYDCVCGTRVATRKHGDSLVRRMASRFANVVRNWVTHESISDSGCGYRVFRRECVRDLKYFRGMHRFLPTLIRMEGFTVTEVPITHQPRLSGQSHYGVWDRLLASSCDLLAVRWMQMRMTSFQVGLTINFSALGSGRREAAIRLPAAEEALAQDTSPLPSETKDDAISTTFDISLAEPA
jgi:dolichol-phosphate mannosyltransferase